LHLWRLLDWRFLLPTLQPSRVMYAGTVDLETIAALKLLDPQSSPLAPANPVPSGCDVVFLRNPKREELMAAAAQVRPGGWICAEVKRSLNERSRPFTVAGWQRAFHLIGLQDVQAHWHPPTLAWSTRMVRVDDVTAVRDTLRRHQEVKFGRLKELVGVAALRLRLFAFAIPEGTVVGRRPVAQEDRA
jgi:hypothetical protein